MKDLRGLLGRPPADFRRGRRVELETRKGRLVRGVVADAGPRLAQLDVGGGRVALVDYADVKRIREPADVAPLGNWMPTHPDIEKARAASTSEWRTWKP